MEHRAIRGLYAITPELADTATLLYRVECALKGGVRVLQYRHKTAAPELALSQALKLRELTRAYPCALIINDDIDLAIRIQADGVHLGRDDGDITRVRNLVPNMLIGISCYNELHRAENAVAHGASYVAFGSFFVSGVKPDAVRADVQLIIEAKRLIEKRRITVPIVAIGGITLENAAPLIDAGVDAIAVISALFDTPDIETTARKFTSQFNQEKHV